MGLLKEFSKEYKTVSIVGMAKNAGKTTTLNYLIEEAEDEGIKLGISSTGRDGETQDAVTGTDKPRVYLYEGTVVSVPSELFELAEAGLEILKMTDYRTSLGLIMICLVKDEGYVQIAGPPSTGDHKKLIEEMLAFGCDILLIDGAVDRRSIASPTSSDGIILATGAVLSRNLKKVVEETAHIVGLYGLPVLKEEKVIKAIESSDREKILFIEGIEGEEENYKLRELNRDTALTSSRYIDEEIGPDTAYVYLPGALTKGVLEDINLKKLKNFAFVLKDPTKIFVDAVDWQQWKKKGMKLVVLENIKVIAVSVNPTSPSGYSFDYEALLSFMKEAMPGIPVIDVKR